MNLVRTIPHGKYLSDLRVIATATTAMNLNNNFGDTGAPARFNAGTGLGGMSKPSSESTSSSRPNVRRQDTAPAGDLASDARRAADIVNGGGTRLPEGTLQASRPAPPRPNLTATRPAPPAPNYQTPKKPQPPPLSSAPSRNDSPASPQRRKEPERPPLNGPAKSSPATSQPVSQPVNGAAGATAGPPPVKPLQPAKKVHVKEPETKPSKTPAGVSAAADALEKPKEKEKRMSTMTEVQIMEKLRQVVCDDDPKLLYSKIKKVGQG